MSSKAMAEDQGLIARIAFNGKEAIQELLELKTSGIRVCMVLMDVEMPLMNGIEATKAINLMILNGELPNVPIVGLSGNDTKEEEEKCLESGMKEYICKPISHNRFISVLQKYNCL